MQREIRRKPAAEQEADSSGKRAAGKKQDDSAEGSGKEAAGWQRRQQDRRKQWLRLQKKLLSNHRKVKQSIPLLEAELQEMKETDAGIGNSTVFDYRTGYGRPQSVVGFDGDLYNRREKTLEKKKEQVRAVEQWINQIEEGQARYVFKMYYINGMTWEKIAVKTGYSNSPDYPRLYIRDKYLKEHGIK